MLLYFPYLAREIEGMPLRVAPSLKVILLIILELTLFTSLYPNPSKPINILKAL